MIDFILEKNPWLNHDDDDLYEVIGILDKLVMDPLERILIKRNFFKNKSEQSVLAYAGYLLKEYIDYYRNREEVMTIELVGYDYALVESIAEVFERGLANLFIVETTNDYHSRTVTAANILVLAITKGGKDIDGSYDDIECRKLTLKQKAPSLIMEAIGYEIIDGYRIAFMVLYDRMHNKNGYVGMSF